MVNTIILIVKYYIYVQKCFGNVPQFEGVICNISKYKAIEFKISYELRNFDKINKKWCMYDM